MEQHHKHPWRQRRLIKDGLEPGFAGKIKCYNCHSMSGELNFVTAVATALRAADRNECSVSGYTDSISSEYENDQDNHSHKRGQKHGNRASDNREKVNL